MKEAGSGVRDRLKAVLVLEGIAFAIALVAPVTPSKTGLTWSPAEVFVADPNYLQKALASFLTVNLMIVFLGKHPPPAHRLGWGEKRS